MKKCRDHFFCASTLKKGKFSIQVPCDFARTIFPVKRIICMLHYKCGLKREERNPSPNSSKEYTKEICSKWEHTSMPGVPKKWTPLNLRICKLYFPYFTTFCNQTLLSGCSGGFCFSCLDEN